MNTGESFVLSFFRSVSGDFPGVFPFKKSRFKIVLSKCDIFPPTRYSNFDPVIYPNQYQIVYCEEIISALPSNQIVVKFTANDNYNILWVFTEADPEPENIDKGSFVHFGLPELINVSNFSAGNSPSTTPPDCTTTIGPNPANCSITNAAFIWEDPTGNDWLPNPGTQSFSLNTSTTYGTYKLKMTFPQAIQPTSTCATYGNVEAPVFVPQCGACLPPQINISATAPYTLTQNPNGDYVICECSDCNMIINLSTNLTSNIQWYRDGSPIPGWLWGMDWGGNNQSLQQNGAEIG